MRYKKGYKYQLDAQLRIDLNKYTSYMLPTIDTYYISIQNNILRINKGYAWDGPSGPTIDTKSFMIGSIVHDALYQLMRSNYLAQAFRYEADIILGKICAENGMPTLRKWCVVKLLGLFGQAAASSNGIKRIIVV